MRMERTDKAHYQMYKCASKLNDSENIGRIRKIFGLLLRKNIPAIYYREDSNLFP